MKSEIHNVLLSDELCRVLKIVCMTRETILAARQCPKASKFG